MGEFPLMTLSIPREGRGSGLYLLSLFRSYRSGDLTLLTLRRIPERVNLERREAEDLEN